MKLFIALSLLLTVSSSVYAELIKTPCEPRDYQKLNVALKTHEIREGVKYKKALLEVLMQEMGPRCNVVTDTVIRPTIPGQRTLTMEIVAGSSRYDVIMISGIETPKPYVIIVRN